MKKVLLPFACALCAVAMNAQDATLVSTTPVTIASGFNVDCVAENPMRESTDKDTYPHMDGHHSMLLVNGTINVLSNPQVPVEGGIPADGAITTSSGYKYQLASFKGNNDLYLGQKGESGTLVFESPIEGCTNVAILMCPTDGYDGGSNSCAFSTVITYDDGTTENVDTRVTPDWGSAKAYRMTQRFRGDGQPFENNNAGLHEEVFSVKSGAKVKSMTFTCESEPMEGAWGGYTCYGRFNFLAASALVMETSGIDAVATENAEVVAIYNIAGVKVNDFVKGVNVVKYSDGKVRKIFVNK